MVGPAIYFDAAYRVCVLIEALIEIFSPQVAEDVRDEDVAVFLDEVAAHLDAGRRAALYDEICTLGSQAWMTGTGPELFEEFGSRAQHLLVSENNNKSEVKMQ